MTYISDVAGRALRSDVILRYSGACSKQDNYETSYENMSSAVQCEK